MALLVDLAKYKVAIGETSAANDSLHTEAIEDASAAVINYTNRDFGIDDPASERTYRYDGSGFLEIDDAATVTQVKLEDTVIPAAQWEAKKEGPDNFNVYSYLELPPFDPSLFSGEMGFTYNLDVYLQRAVLQEIDVKVTADWGFTPVPDDVQRATIYIAVAMEQSSRQGSGVLASESIAEVARAYLTTDAIVAEPFPRAAALLLDSYRRHII